MFAVMVSVVLEKSLDDIEQPLVVPVYGAEQAPGLMAWLATRNIEARPEAGGLPEARQQVLDGEEPVTLNLSLIHISEPTRPTRASRMPSSA